MPYGKRHSHLGLSLSVKPSLRFCIHSYRDLLFLLGGFDFKFMADEILCVRCVCRREMREKKKMSEVAFFSLFAVCITT